MVMHAKQDSKKYEKLLEDHVLNWAAITHRKSCGLFEKIKVLFRFLTSLRSSLLRRTPL